MSASEATSDSSVSQASADVRLPIDELADEFLARLRRGAKPSVEEYATSNPELADEIRELFPTLAMLEDFAPDEALRDKPSSAKTHGTIPEQIGEYRILQEIGRGGMGVVYEAEHDTMGRRVALKVLPAQAAARGKNLGRFLREARAAGRLHHTNIVPVFEVGVDEAVHFYAMQYIRGQNLDVVIEELQRLQELSGSQSVHGQRGSGATGNALSRSVALSLMSGVYTAPDQVIDPLSDPVGDKLADVAGGEGGDQELREHAADDVVDAGTTGPIVVPDTSDLSNVGRAGEGYFQRVARIGLQIAEALDYAHMHGITHRDIKPSNLILDTAGVVWVTDFGLARSEGDELTHTGDVVGTLRYMAPERFSGQADARSDLYSLGLTLYELCTLRYAFEHTDRARLIRQLTSVDPANPRRRNPSIPRDLETIILKAIDKQPEHRYSSARAMAEDLRLFLSDRPITARRASAVEHIWRWCRRNPLPAGMLTCIGLLLTIIVAGSLVFAVKSSEQAKLLTAENLRAVSAEAKAQAANRVATERLFESHVRHAQAERWSRRPGQHYESLAALADAAFVLPKLEMSEADREKQVRLLRDEAIAAMALMDVREVKRISSPDKRSPAMAYDHSGTRYAKTTYEGEVTVHDIDDDSILMTLPAEGDQAQVMTFSPGGRFLCCQYNDPANSALSARIRVWDLSNGKAVVEREGNNVHYRVTFSPADNLIAISHADRSVEVITLPEGEITATRRFERVPIGASFSPDGSRIALVDRYQDVHLWSHADDEVEVIDPDTGAASVNWCPQTNLLAVGELSGLISLWDMGQPLSQTPQSLEGHTAYVSTISQSADGSMLASVSWDGTTRIWDLSKNMPMLRIDGHSQLGALCHPGFSSDSRHLTVSTTESHALLEVTNGGPLRILSSRRDPGRRWATAWHPHEPRLMVAANDRLVEFWDTETGQIIKSINLGRTRSAFFTLDGQSLVTSGNRGILRLQVTVNEDDTQPLSVDVSEPEVVVAGWFKRMDHDASRRWIVSERSTQDISIASLVGEPNERIFGKHGNIDRVAMSPDGKWVVTATWGGKGVHVWNPDTGELVRDLDPDATSTAIAISPDGQWLAGSSRSGHLTIWRVGTWDVAYRAHRPIRDKWPGAIAFSPDSRMAAVPSSRFVNRLVRLDTFETVATLESPHRETLDWAGFSPDGQQLVVASTNMRLWDLRDLRHRLAEMNLDWDD